MTVSKIVMDRVTKVYSGDVRAVDDVTLEISSGEFMVSSVPRGAGSRRSFG